LIEIKIKSQFAAFKKIVKKIVESGLGTSVLSIGCTETKYIKLETQFQIFLVDVSTLFYTFENSFSPYKKTVFLFPFFKCIKKNSFTPTKNINFF
jgi:hypothetical protein